MPRIRALQSFVGRRQGEVFDANETDARILCAPDALGGQKAEYVDRAMRSSEQPASAPAAEPPSSSPARRRYMRRDMRAQE